MTLCTERQYLLDLVGYNKIVTSIIIIVDDDNNGDDNDDEDSNNVNLGGRLG